MDLKKASWITLFLGLTALAVLSFSLEPKSLAIAEIGSKNTGSFVKISGEVIKVSQSTITSFDLDDRTGRIKVVSFDKVNVSKGEFLEVIGKVDEYRGSLEIVAEKISKKNGSMDR